MRYVPIEYVREGMILGRTLYGNNGEVLLRNESIIRRSYVKKLIYLGYCGIYVNDELSQDITVTEVISEELKMRTIKSIKNLMNPIRTKKQLQSSFKIIENLMENIVDEISGNEDIMVNMMVDLCQYIRHEKLNFS